MHAVLVLLDEGGSQLVEAFIGVYRALREDVEGVGVLVRGLDPDGRLVGHRDAEGVGRRRDGIGHITLREIDIGRDRPRLIESEGDAVERRLGVVSVVGHGLGARRDLGGIELLERVVSVVGVLGLQHRDGGSGSGVGTVFLVQGRLFDRGPVEVARAVFRRDADGDRSGALSCQLEREVRRMIGRRVRTGVRFRIIASAQRSHTTEAYSQTKEKFFHGR